MSIYRRKGSPHWWISISIAGTKTRRTTGTADRGKAAQFEAAERDRLWGLYKLRDRSYIRWTEAAARWLNELPEKSRYKEESIISWFDKHLREEPLRAIDREAIEELRHTAHIEEGKSCARTDRMMANLRAVLMKSAKDWGYLPAAPHVPMYNQQAPEMHWLTRLQFKALKAQLPDHLALAAEFAVLTGLRMRSMLRLTWDRIDLKTSRLWVPGEQMKGRKAAAHGLPLSRPVKKLLRKLKTLSPTGDHVFQYNNEPIDDCNTRAFQEAVTRAGVGPLRWHDLRHTFAAWAVQSGVTLVELMELGGWKTYSSVLRYKHLAPDHLAEAAELIGHSGHSKKRKKQK